MRIAWFACEVFGLVWRAWRCVARKSAYLGSVMSTVSMWREDYRRVGLEVPDVQEWWSVRSIEWR
jgi:hypothetical protein